MNNDELFEKLDEVYEILKNNTHNTCTMVTITFNSQGYETEYTLRTPESLKNNGISMKNIRGEWIYNINIATIQSK